ncbi:MAG: Asp-tRNA(Asn)/Glu-tRNA(Gln) amidotransferase subunit GatC [Candidatus Brocadiia bacterium]
MEFTRQQIDDVAHLARIELTEAERELFGAQLASILAYVEKLDELDTTGVEPTAHAMGRRNVFRDDAEQPWPDPQALLANAPARAHGCYLVPKILD